MKRLALLLLLALCACGYHFDGGEKIAVSVPYVIGDQEGELTDSLIWALSRTANFRYTQDEGDWILKAKVVDTFNDRIGYRYDRDPKTGDIRKNVMGTENRKSITVEVSVVNGTTGKLILGPQKVKADADYDYVDPNSLRDVSFIDPATGVRTTSIAFSLGQLDSVGAAGEDATYPIYHLLARKIVDGMLATGVPDDE
ncbi:MAG: hypothetical protein K1000chlam2_00977 [Chlamydiae bacterium]|nr:hypothetical protein [Chlamydiota bacterium]